MMRFAKLFGMWCAAALVAGALFTEPVSNGNSRQQLVTDGGAPLPTPPLIVDGGAPLPTPPLADGGAPLPTPPLVADGGAPLPTPPRVGDGGAPLPTPPRFSGRTMAAAFC
jgi:hypothetical protein